MLLMIVDEVIMALRRICVKCFHRTILHVVATNILQPETIPTRYINQAARTVV